MEINKDLLESLLAEAKENPRLRQNFDLRTSFPLLTTKKLHTRSIIYELLWFLKGDTNIKYLNDNRVTIWDEGADCNMSCW